MYFIRYGLSLTSTYKVTHNYLHELFISYQQVSEGKFVKKTLKSWLEWIQTLSPMTIDLSLDRVRTVAERLKFLQSNCPVMTVAGTNGKGSTVAFAEQVYLYQGYRVGIFNSPILFHHNETVRIQGKEVSDEDFCTAFETVEAVREGVLLTPFEFNTLAALEILHRAKLDVWILEVGLGGRLDAVNVVDADVAVITTIGLDHTEYLGDTREKIALEKAGIFRAHHPAVCGDLEPPHSLIDYAKKLSTPLYCSQKDFHFSVTGNHWQWQCQQTLYQQLPLPQLALQNVATSLMSIELLQNKLPVHRDAIVNALTNATLPGRMQIISKQPTIMLDVAHNPPAATFLAAELATLKPQKKITAIFSMLQDKDILQTILAMKDIVDEWHIAALSTSRACRLEDLQRIFAMAKIVNVHSYSTIEQACQQVIQRVKKNDVVIIFGSFHTVANAFATLKTRA